MFMQLDLLCPRKRLGELTQRISDPSVISQVMHLLALTCDEEHNALLVETPVGSTVLSDQDSLASKGLHLALQLVGDLMKYSYLCMCH